MRDAVTGRDNSKTKGGTKAWNKLKPSEEEMDSFMLSEDE